MLGKSEMAYRSKTANTGASQKKTSLGSDFKITKQTFIWTIWSDFWLVASAWDSSLSPYLSCFTQRPNQDSPEQMLMASMAMPFSCYLQFETHLYTDRPMKLNNVELH